MKEARYKYSDGRLYLRPVNPDDAIWVCKWRNSDKARAAFFSGDVVVTPDTHAALVTTRALHDLIWMICDDADQRVGMAALTVDTDEGSAQFGRLVISPEYEGKGFAERIVRLALAFAWDVLNLNYCWLVVKADNKAAIALYDHCGWRIDHMWRAPGEGQYRMIVHRYETVPVHA